MFQFLKYLFVFIRKLSFLFLIIGLVSCNFDLPKSYTFGEQFGLANDRLEEMRSKISVSTRLENNIVLEGEKIYFWVNIFNTSHLPVTVRKPKQSGVLEITHANTTILFSVASVNASMVFWYPNEYFGYEIAKFPIQPDEFIKLDSNKSIDVRLELPNIVFLKNGEKATQSELPVGEYIVNIKYQNHYIGYMIEQDGEVLYIDKDAWVGEIDTEPFLLKIIQ